VNEIIYEADRVDHYVDQEEWKSHVVDQEYLESLSPNAVEELQFVSPNNPMKVFHGYSMKELDHGRKRYKALHKEQLVSASIFSLSRCSKTLLVRGPS
jgi:hypothetical protein